MSFRRRSGVLPSLLLTLIGAPLLSRCAVSTRPAVEQWRRDDFGESPGGDEAASSSDAVDADARPSPSERPPRLEEACGDIEAFASLLLAEWDGARRDALERHLSRRSGAGAGDRSETTASLSADDRLALEEVARIYVARCGLQESIAIAKTLISFPTVSALESPENGASFDAMGKYLDEWAEAQGLDFHVFGANEAWVLGLGKGAPSVAFVMHADVVPVSDGVDPQRAPPGGARTSSATAGETSGVPSGWTVPPFRATVSGGRLYGRGAEDDKGPIASAMLVLRTLAHLDLEPRGRVIVVLGTGEEHDWTGMKKYADQERKARHVVSVDANFPVVVAESGFVAWQLAAPLRSKARRRRVEPAACIPVLDVRGGQFLTQVPAEASLVLQPARSEDDARFLARLHAAARAAEEDLGPGFRFEIEADRAAPRALRLIALGEAVHSSVAEEGHNAIWALANAAERLDLCSGGAATMLRAVARRFVGDHWGERLDLAYADPVMGRLLVSPTVLRIEEDRAKLSINMRRPNGMSSADFAKKLDRALDALKREVDPEIVEIGERYVGEPAMADTNGPLVPTLLEIYRSATGDSNAAPIAIRGGTYARLFPGAVSFGPAIPGRPYRGHAPDEYIELEALDLLNRALLEAALRLDAM